MKPHITLAQSLKPVPQASLVDTVVERIRAAIEKGSLTPGSRLPSEMELAASLSVSRTVLREAIRRLETVGVVTVRRGSGMYVGNRSGLSSCMELMRSAMQVAPREMLLFAEFRSALECYAARRAAELATPEDIADLKRLCQEMDEPGIPDDEAIRIDFEFHRRLLAISRNELMDSVMDVVREFVLEGMQRTTPHPRNTRLSQSRHADILAGIEAYSPDAAEEAMRMHMAGVLQRLR